MTPTHVRFGASSLAASAVLFAIFPLSSVDIRPGRYAGEAMASCIDAVMLV